MARFKAPKRALSLPNEHSITLRALHNLYLKYCSCADDPPLAYSFIRYGNKG